MKQTRITITLVLDVITTRTNPKKLIEEHFKDYNFRTKKFYIRAVTFAVNDQNDLIPQEQQLT